MNIEYKMDKWLIKKPAGAKKAESVIEMEEKMSDDEVTKKIMK